MIKNNKILIQLLELAETCLKAKSDPKDISTILDKVNLLLPFENAVLAIDNRQIFSLTSEQQIFTRNVNECWPEIYQQEKFWHDDYVLAEISKKAVPVEWQSAASKYQDINPKFKSLYEEHLGKQGLSIQNTTTEGITILSLAMAEGSISSEHLSILNYLTPHIHEVFNRAGENQRKNLHAPHLSKREREVMHWAKEGKSSWDISMILSISERTVKFHFSNVFKKLNVVNRPQAIAKAIFHGLIKV